ncbi:MAG: aldehyde dehydrogenase family protein [Planctomycetaceae bacterium]
MSSHPVLIDGQWRPSVGQQTFQSVNPRTRELLPGVFPVSPWSEIEQAIHAAHRAFVATAGWPGERFARFLDQYAQLIDAHAAELVATAHAETALPVEPRLAKAELPRTSNQLHSVPLTNSLPSRNRDFVSSPSRSFLRDKIDCILDLLFAISHRSINL